MGAKVLPDNALLSVLLTYGMDWIGAGWHYADVGRVLLRSFWGAFGWGHVPLSHEETYACLAAITFIAVAGCLVRLATAPFLKGSAPLPKLFTWEIGVLFSLVLLLAWGSTFVRGTIYLASSVFYVPVARYAMPAIIPTALILAGGWIFILSAPFRLPKRWKDHPQIPAGWIYSLGLLSINVYALWSIYQYYK
jgi:hypothetical protein